jgi:aspartate/methionine/tyrosine aminotransferase
VNEVNPLAIELNETIRENAPALYASLSALGRELYFPRGILSQAAEAKKNAHRHNATIGIATTGGKPLHLPSLMRFFHEMDAWEAFPYAPATGLPELRGLWREHQLEINPGLKDKSFSMPVVTSGLTHGLSICADLFCDAGDVLLLPDKIWGNYRMIYETRRGADIRQYPLFQSGGGMDTWAFRDTLFSCIERPKILVILNYPNNPTGYAPTPKEAEDVAAALMETAQAGGNIVAVVDDAYFGLVYEEGAFKESLFSLIADAHPNLTAVKLDGPTKEDYVWGFRVGLVTFSCAGGGDQDGVYQALEKKVGGLIRGTISNCSMPAQSLLIKAMKSTGYRQEKEEIYRLLRDRYREVKRVVYKERYVPAFEPYPFNSGYFMCVAIKGVDAETLRRHLLNEYGVGTISLGDTDLRVAFSCLEREQVEDLFDILYTAVDDLRRDK